MKPENLAPDSVSSLIPFTAATCERLEKDTTGGISADGKWAWLVSGSFVEVVSTSSGERFGAWCFGVVERNPQCSITCARELKDGKSPKLMIGLDCSGQNALLCLFDIRKSKVIRAIEVPSKITSLEIVSTEGGANPANHALLNDLRYMFGIVAVGIDNGSLLLVDLFLDELWCSDEKDVWGLQYMRNHLKRPDEERNVAVHTKRHLCLALLSKNICLSRHDAYCSEKAVRDCVGSCITNLKYLPQLTCLSVGYENGSVDFWNLNKLTLESSIHKATRNSSELPVVEVAFQEPENDPSQFCYLWIARGDQLANSFEDSLSSLTLYALKFTKKCWMQGIGNHYEYLTDCDRRFEYYFGCNPHQTPDYNVQGSRLLRCYALRDSVVSPNVADEASRDDIGLDATEYSLLVVVWEAWFKDTPAKLHAFIGVFDLNQWYQAQMPPELNVAGTTMSSYFGFFSLDDVLEKAAPDFLLDIQIFPGSLNHLRLTFPTENHFFPSALAFRTCCLIDAGVIQVSYLGLQRQMLAKMAKLGALVLMEPHEMYNMCVYSGLIRPSDDIISNSSPSKQREALLNVALENGLLEFINLSVSQTNVRDTFISSYSPSKTIMEWAWRKTGQIKSALDRMCLPLFNCSGEQVDAGQIRLLHIYGTQLEMLASTFQLLINHSTLNTEQGLRELETKLNVINLIVLHHRVVLWFYHAGLLPEHEESHECTMEEFSYPVSILQQAYLHRRAELQGVNQMIRDSNVLIIDNIVEKSGKSLSSLWMKDGGTELYPPPSLYSLLNVYLLDDVSISVKHCIVQYLLLDLSVCLVEDKYDHLLSQLMKFPVTFNVSPSLSKLTRAFWLLDHKDFDGALEHLLDPLINTVDLYSWQNAVIMRSFLYQGHCKKALKFSSIRKPAITSPEDMKLRLTVLLANELITEAFQYQRDCRDADTSAEILHHFFLGCQQTKSLKNLLQLPLNSVEEEAFIQFMQNSNDIHAQEILLMYFIQRSRFVQARMLNASLTTKLVNEHDPAIRELSAIRNMIVDGYASVLPRVQLKLASYADGSRHYRSTTGLNVKPVPLSAAIKSGTANITSHATLIKTVMDKVGETWCTSSSFAAIPFRHGVYQNNEAARLADNVPFICTPAASRSRVDMNDTPALIFPTTGTKDGDFFDHDYVISPVKRSRGMEISSAKRLPSKSANMELMSLLQMPPVHRKTPARSAVKTQERIPSQPQSILKSFHSGIIMEEVQNELDLSRRKKNVEVKDVKDQSGLAKQLRFDVCEASSPEISFEDAQQNVLAVEATTRSSLLRPDRVGDRKHFALEQRFSGSPDLEPEESKTPICVTKRLPLSPSSGESDRLSSDFQAERSFMSREPITYLDVSCPTKDAKVSEQPTVESKLKETRFAHLKNGRDSSSVGFVFRHPLQLEHHSVDEDMSVQKDTSDQLTALDTSEPLAVEETCSDMSESEMQSQPSSRKILESCEDTITEVLETSGSYKEADQSDAESIQSSRSELELSSKGLDLLQASSSTITVTTSFSSASSSPASKTSSTKTFTSNASSPVTRSKTKTSYESPELQNQWGSRQSLVPPKTKLEPSSDDTFDDQPEALGASRKKPGKELSTSRQIPSTSEGTRARRILQTKSDAQLRRSVRRSILKDVLDKEDEPHVHSKADTKQISAHEPETPTKAKTEKFTLRLKSSLKRTSRLQKTTSTPTTSELLLMVPPTHSYGTRSASGDSVSSISPVSVSSTCSTASTQKKADRKPGRPGRPSKKSIGLLGVESEHKFFFSPPQLLGQHLAEDDTSAIDEVKPFIFSPPLTRSKTKRRRKPSELTRSDSILDSPPKTTTIMVEKTKRNRTLATSPRSMHSSSAINFVSPAVLRETSKVKKQKKKPQSSTAARLLRSRTHVPLTVKKLD